MTKSLDGAMRAYCDLATVSGETHPSWHSSAVISHQQDVFLNLDQSKANSIAKTLRGRMRKAIRLA
jgi:hypothetical protein